MTHRRQGAAQSLALQAVQALDLDGVGRRYAIADVPDLLSDQQIEEDLLRLEECIDIFPAAPQCPDACKPRARRALDHMVTNRQRACGGHEPEQASLLEVDPIPYRSESAEHTQAGLGPARSLDQQLGKRELASSRIETCAPHPVCEARITVHEAHIKKYVHRQQV